MKNTSEKKYLVDDIELEPEGVETNMLAAANVILGIFTFGIATGVCAAIAAGCAVASFAVASYNDYLK